MTARNQRSTEQNRWLRWIPQEQQRMKYSTERCGSVLVEVHARRRLKGEGRGKRRRTKERRLRGLRAHLVV
eukprot:2450614-Rhodomonas_salina.1